MCKRVPEETKRNLVYKPYGKHPMSLSIIQLEVDNDTKRGIKILNEMGYEDDWLEKN